MENKVRMCLKPYRSTEQSTGTFGSSLSLKDKDKSFYQAHTTLPGVVGLRYRYGYDA